MSASLLLPVHIYTEQAKRKFLLVVLLLEKKRERNNWDVETKFQSVTRASDLRVASSLSSAFAILILWPLWIAFAH